MVIWTPRARNDLKSIHDYIAQETPTNAKSVTRDILNRAASISELPYTGKVVREVNDPNIREVSVHSWRIVYHVRNQQIFIVSLIHKRRQVSTQDLQ